MTISQYLKWRKMNFGHFLFTFTKNNGNRKWESLIFLRIKKRVPGSFVLTLFFMHFFISLQPAQSQNSALFQPSHGWHQT
jgi:hypothetical protein